MDSRAPPPYSPPPHPLSFFFLFYYFNLRRDSLLRCIWKLSKSSRRQATFPSSDRTSAMRAEQPCGRGRRAETETSSPFSLTAVSKYLKLFILSYQTFAHKNRKKRCRFMASSPPKKREKRRKGSDVTTYKSFFKNQQ